MSSGDSGEAEGSTLAETAEDYYICRSVTIPTEPTIDGYPDPGHPGLSARKSLAAVRLTTHRSDTDHSVWHSTT